MMLIHLGWSIPSSYHTRIIKLEQMFNSNSIYGSQFKRQNKGQSYGDICEKLRDSHMGHFKVSLIKNTACTRVPIWLWDLSAGSFNLSDAICFRSTSWGPLMLRPPAPALCLTELLASTKLRSIPAWRSRKIKMLQLQSTFWTGWPTYVLLTSK